MFPFPEGYPLSVFKNLPSPPAVAKKPVSDTRHGITRTDDYAWLRADDHQPLINKATRGLYPPGSTLKPLVYALAFDEGLGHPETMIDDKPMTFGAYAPQNFDRQYRGTIRLREALQLSLNIPVVALTSSRSAGTVMHRLRLMEIPEETAPPKVLVRAAELRKAAAEHTALG